MTSVTTSHSFVRLISLCKVIRTGLDTWHLFLSSILYTSLRYDLLKLCYLTSVHTSSLLSFLHLWFLIFSTYILWEFPWIIFIISNYIMDISLMLSIALLPPAPLQGSLSTQCTVICIIWFLCILNFFSFVSYFLRTSYCFILSEDAGRKCFFPMMTISFGPGEKCSDPAFANRQQAWIFPWVLYFLIRAEKIKVQNQRKQMSSHV